MNDAKIHTESHQEDRTVAIWLLVCCALIFAMVVLGGVTRLTGSGLSMVDWRPISGVLPPLSDTAWQQTFEMYQQTPEFKKVNTTMNLEGFKGIFWLEYLHRILGRFIGIVFFVPFVFFLVRGSVRRHEIPKYLLMFVLGGLQGLLGWYMVKSGLVDIPAVSQYRLTAHLIAAFLIYAYMLWVAMGLLYPKESRNKHAWFGRGIGFTSLVAITIVSGGFVAGLKAGKIFNTFPMMGEHWIAPGALALEPAWRNLFDNPALVQFNHRLLAITTFMAGIAFWLGVRRQTSIDARTRAAQPWLLAALLTQVTLGILTLLYHVPVALAATHQAVAMLLFTVCLFTLHGLRYSPQSGAT